MSTSNKKILTSYVRTEKEDNALEKYANKLGMHCEIQWVKSGKGEIVACDFFKD